MAIYPWRWDFTKRNKRPMLQGSDFVDVVTFPVLGGLAVNWTGFAVRAQLRTEFADYTDAALATIDCTIIDPVARIVRFRIPAATTVTLKDDSGRWDAELYRFDTDGNEIDVARFVNGLWELSREVTR